MNCSVNVMKQLKNASSMIFRNKVNEELLIIICDNLAEIYKDGINIDYGIEIISDAIFDKSYKESLNVVLKYIKEGRTLSESFNEVDELYPPFFIGMLAVGESSGSLYKILIALKIFYEKSVFIKKEIKKELSYPK
ncbi:type II secretion system F family protein, partial [Clostridium neonatale]